MRACFMHSPRPRIKKLQPSNQHKPIRVGSSVLRGIENDLRDVREGILSTEEAMRQAGRRTTKRLMPHWQKMLESMRNSERDLLALRTAWEQRPDVQG